MKALVATLVAVLGFGCSKTSKPTAVDAGGASEAPTAATARAPAAPRSAKVPLPNVGLANRLTNESNTRPAGTPKAEDVYDALAKAGMRVVEKQQHMAAPFGAQYCLGAKVESQLALSVCEYESEQAAKDGRETSLRAFKFVVNREIAIKKATTFTIREESKTPEIDAVAKRAKELFDGL